MRCSARGLLTAAAIGLSYLVTARMGLLIDAVGGFATLVWAPTGISLASVLILGPRIWPGIFVGACAANLWAGAQLPVALGISAGNTLEALVGALALRWIPGFDRSLSRVRDVVGLIGAGALFSTTISATVGMASLALGGEIGRSELWVTWRTWWLGDVIGDLIIAPLILAWSWGGIARLPWWRAIEIVGIAISLALATVLFEGLPSGAVTPLGHSYFFFPPLVWAVLRFGQRGAVTATFLVEALAVWGTASGYGPFVRPTLHASLYALQLFTAIMASTFLVLGAATAEREIALEAVSVARSDLADLSATRREEAKLRRLLATAPDAMAIVKRNGTIAIVNSQLLKTFGYQEDELEGKPIEQLIPERFREAHTRHRVGYVEDPSPRPMGQGRELFGRRRDGSEFPVEVSLAPMEWDEDLLITAAIRDLTERKLGEERLRASLAEKEVLLKEVHHRVKNSLQVIASLLGLQARRAEGTAWGTALSESLGRIRSIAQVHEQLYRSRDLASVPFQDYATNLCRTLLGMYVGGRSVIALKVSAEGVGLGIDVAIPCGLIIHELVTNALRHAFPGGRAGLVWVNLRGTGGTMTLEVGDDGVGLPEDLDLRQTRSLGLQLVMRLVDQLHGTMQLVRDGGTRVVIEFPRAAQPAASPSRAE